MSVCEFETINYSCTQLRYNGALYGNIHKLMMVLCYSTKVIIVTKDIKILIQFKFKYYRDILELVLYSPLTLPLRDF